MTGRPGGDRLRVYGADPVRMAAALPVARVAMDDREGHGLRLLRSHAGGIGELLPEEQIRAMLAVRANQLLAGGAGVPPEVADVLASALNAGAYPAVHEFGAIGTEFLARKAFGRHRQ